MTKTKQQIIATMLANYRDAQETLRGPTDEPGDGDGITLMPPTWNTSYRELERCLTNLYHEHPTLFAHLRERYLATQPYNEIVRKVDIGPRGNPHLPATNGPRISAPDSYQRFKQQKRIVQITQGPNFRRAWLTLDPG